VRWHQQGKKAVAFTTFNKILSFALLIACASCINVSIKIGFDNSTLVGASDFDKNEIETELKHETEIDPSAPANP